MPSPTELLRLAFDWRLDALATLAVMSIACAASRNHVVRKGAGADFSRAACALAFFLPLAGALATEWNHLLLQSPAHSTLRSLAATRLSMLGATGLAGVVLLWAAVKLAILRAKLRTQADTERQLQEAKRAADEANRAKSDFLAVMSHEIRTPLNAVIGFANLLRNTPLEEAQRAYLATITSEGERLGCLINDLLDLSKIDGGQLQIERVPFAPTEVVAEVLRLFAARANHCKVDLRFEGLIVGPLLVSGDPLRFRQILVNLVDNALKFTPRGAVTVFQSWAPPTASEPHGRLITRVRDTGIGIPADKLPRLFQMFMQADSSTSRTYGGTGLGLAICHRLVGLMGGEISVQSTPGAGSEFKFSLPLLPVAISDALPEEPPLEVEFATPPRILVVDDLETNRFLLEVFLRRNGFEPEMASGGEEAVRMARTRTYDAILMDLQMPQVDGYMATARIRAEEPAGRHTVIIALTASIARGTREKCLAAGMDEHMTKPLDLARFRLLLSTLLATKRSLVPA